MCLLCICGSHNLKLVLVIIFLGFTSVDLRQTCAVGNSSHSLRGEIIKSQVENEIVFREAGKTYMLIWRLENYINLYFC